MSRLPPEDRPDEVYIEGVGGIPIIDEDDPRFEGEREAWSAAAARAQALHSAEELLGGVRDPDWRVRFESVDRLVARWGTDERTLPALLRLVSADPVWQVRERALLQLVDFEAPSLESTLRRALRDKSSDVRSSARYVMDQLGFE